MSFTAPFALIALLAVPTVAALHLFQRRLRERRVAGLFLWAPQQMRAASGRRVRRIARTSSLLLELLAALFLALWLGGLTIGGAAIAEHHILVVDDSASMAARRVDGTTTADDVRRAVRARIDGATRGSTFTVIASGQRPRMLCGPEASALDAASAVATYDPRRPAHDLQPALELASSLAAATPSSTIAAFSDQLANEASARAAGAELFAFGEPCSNAAITSARRSTRDDAQRLLVDVRHWVLPRRNEQAGRLVVLDERGEALAVTPLDRPETSNSQVTRLEIDLPAGEASGGTLTCTLELPGDGLAMDDRMVVLPDRTPLIRVATTLPPSVLDVLALDRLLGRHAVRTDDASQAHLLVTGSPPDDPPASRHALVLEPLGDEGRDSWLGPYLFDRLLPWSEGLTLDGVVWTAGRGTPPGRPFIQAGDQVLASVTEDVMTSALTFTCNIEVEASSLARAPDWPILFENVLRGVRERMPGPVDPQPSIGQMIRWRCPPSVDRGTALIELEEPGGGRRPAPVTREVTWPAESPGVHRVLVDGDEMARFAVQFVDSVESDLRAAERGHIEAHAPPQAQDQLAVSRASGVARTLLALAALACIVLDALALHRARSGRMGPATTGGVA